MSDKALAKTEAFPDDKVALIKRTVAQGTTDDELELFLYTAKRTGLDPLANQIHAVKRWNAVAKRQTMAIQVGIDGYRLIADRTEKYAPGPEPTFTEDETGKLETATAYVKKLTKDGTWHTVAATAHFSEYCGRKKDGTPNHMWATKPHIMLGKCAEALALRRAFPAELSGVYTREEMDQADNAPIQTSPVNPEPAVTPSEARKEVNTNLWKNLWLAAVEAGFSPEQMWDAVWTIRPELKTDAMTKDTAAEVVAQLTETDFAKLWRGVDAMQEASNMDRQPGGDAREGE